MKKQLSLLIIAILVSASSIAQEPCEINFKKEGSFFKGKKFSTWAEVDGVSADVAFKKVYQHIAKDGWKISNTDKDLGVISAGLDVSYGNGKTAPLNVIIEDLGGSSKITINYSLSGGVSSPTKAVIKSFCNTISAAEKS